MVLPYVIAKTIPIAAQSITITYKSKKRQPRRLTLFKLEVKLS
ncbi:MULTISPECIES: hypothetical protein [Pontibacter]|nr:MULTISPECIES: hypothetical protein [Pontibacter]